MGTVTNRVVTLLTELYECWQPHQKQADFIAAVMQHGVKRVFLEWGRRTGKSESEVVLIALWSQFYPGAQSYFFAPLRTQVAEIIWKPQKIQNVIPQNWIDNINETDMRVYWANSPIDRQSRKSTSWLKLDGADREEARRGVEPRKGILVIDEVREIKRSFWNAMRPVLAKWDSPVIFSSTPPDSLTDEEDPTKPHWVIEVADECAINPKRSYIHATSYDNPHLSAGFLDSEREELLARGEEDIWRREYLAERVAKKTGRIFPMVQKSVHVTDYSYLLTEITQEPRDWQYYMMTDPANKSCWAWNIICCNKYTKRVIVLDEIDEQNHAMMTTTGMWGQAQALMYMLEVPIEDWNLHYDEAESWFAAEMIDKFDVAFSPSAKRAKSKSEGFTVLKDMFLAKQIVMSDKCIHTFWELENYEGDKSRDHHVDILRYFVHVSGISVRQHEKRKADSEHMRMKKKWLKRWEEDKDEKVLEWWH